MNSIVLQIHPSLTRKYETNKGYSTSVFHKFAWNGVTLSFLRTMAAWHKKHNDLNTGPKTIYYSIIQSYFIFMKANKLYYYLKTLFTDFINIIQSQTALCLFISPYLP